MILPSPDSASTSGASFATPASARERALELLASLPASEIKLIQAYIHSRLSFDVLSALPSELALHILEHLDGRELLVAQGVCRRWHALAGDQALWKRLCQLSGVPHHLALSPRRLAARTHAGFAPMEGLPDSRVDVDDEGTDILPSCPVVGPPRQQPFDDARPTGSALRQELYPGIATLRTLLHALPSSPTRPSASTSSPDRSFVPSHRPPPPPSAQLAPLASALPPTPDSPRLPNFKHLHLTALILSARLSTPAHFLSFTRLPHLTPAPPSLQAHTGSVYCIALRGGLALTGGKDQSVRVWDLADGNERVVGVLEGVHTGSVLTLCTFGCPSSAAEDGASAGGEGEGEGEQAFRVVSGGSDGRLALWEVRRLPPSTADGEAGRWHGECLRAVDAHAESVFGVKSDGDVVVSCSKDRLVKVFDARTLEERLILDGHRGAVNAVCLREGVIVSASGDRTIRLWSADSGELLTALLPAARGYSSLDFDGRYIVSGSSDSKVRQIDLLDPREGLGRTFDRTACTAGGGGACACRCGSAGVAREGHTDLVRAIQYHRNFVVSAGYDQTVKVWDRRSRSLVRDLRGGHSQRILGVAADAAKIVSVGQDGRLCVWRWSQGLDTAFLDV